MNSSRSSSSSSSNHREMQSNDAGAVEVEAEAQLDSIFPHKIFEDGSRYKKAYVSAISGMKASERNHHYIASLVDCEDLSEAHHYFNLALGICSKYVNRVTEITMDNDTIVLFVFEIKGFYDEWCERENDYFQHSKDKHEARDILKNFISILRGVVQGLVCLFEKEKYHGNLSDGIAVDGDLNVSLYNMRKNGHENFEDGIAEDIEEVRDMISIWLSREDEFEELRSLRHYQVKLENKALMKNCNYLWAMHDIMFWSPSQKSKFMETLTYFLPGDRQNLTKSFKYCFSCDWHSLVPEEEDSPFRTFYNERYRDEPPRYCKNVDLIIFWDQAKYLYSDYASESGGKYRMLLSREVEAKMEETFNASHVCFSAIESYLLHDDTSEEDISSKAKLKAALDEVRALHDGPF